MKKIINTFPIVALLLFFFNLISCTNNKLIRNVNQPFKIPTKLKVELGEINNGDLIFVGTTNYGLSGAINRVTQTKNNRNYDHIGLIEKSNDSIFVLHTTPKGGSQREDIHQFYINNKNDTSSIVIFRLINQYQYVVPNAILKAKNMLGKPYNWTYILDNDKYYCSDFIERSFRKDAIFSLIPMNFKNPKTNKIDKFWVDYYKKLNLDVPQKHPGTNPNQLAESDKIIEFGPLFIDKP